MMISEELRRRILDDRALGAGNVLHRLPLYGRSLDERVLWLDGTWRAPSGEHPEVLTLRELEEVVATYAGFYHRAGVRAKDAVAIVTTSITDFALNLMALTSIGAIASLVNANMPVEVRREYIRRQRVVGVMTQPPWHNELLKHLDDDVPPRFVVSPHQLGGMGGHEPLKASLADMEVQLNAAALLTARAAWECDRGGRGFARHSNIAKVHATEAAQGIVDASVQLFGAAGVVRGGITERLYRQIRSLRIYEGSTDVLRLAIADSLDVRRAARAAAGPTGKGPAGEPPSAAEPAGDRPTAGGLR